jgi:N-acyl-D-aspartate/D-glutamate deacylase
VFVWDVVRVEAVRDAANRAWVGATVPQLAAERGQDPLDCFLDVSLAEDLETQFALEMPPSDYFRECTARIVRDPIVVAGSSDGGAHLLSFTGRRLSDAPARGVGARRPDARGGGPEAHRHSRRGPRHPRPRNAT